jgi:CheY-like chemotaxis protein
MTNIASALIIDDDPVFLSALGRTLTECGYGVTESDNVSDGRAFFQTRAFDVAVVDLNLSGENGIELIRQMTLTKQRTRIVATTAVESDLYLQIASYVGAYSGACRSAFRDDGHRDSGLMAIRIPGRSRSRFRAHVDQKRCGSGMLIAIPGMVF